MTYFAYLDEFGHIGPYLGRQHPRHNDSPVFGFAGLVLLSTATPRPPLGSQISTTMPSRAHSSGTSSAWASISRLMWVRMMRFAPKSVLCATMSG